MLQEWQEKDGWITKSIYEINDDLYVRCCDAFHKLETSEFGIIFAQCSICGKEYALGEDGNTESKRQTN